MRSSPSSRSESCFLAALIPGILATIGYSAAIALYVRLVPGSGSIASAVPLRERVRSLAAVWPVAIIFAAVIGGIYFGVFTPTEAAAIGAAATALLAIASGQLGWQAFLSSLLETAQVTGMIFLILISAELYTGFLALSLVTNDLADMLARSGLAPMSILFGIMVVYLLLGCVMDSLAMILLTVPVFFPLITALDFGFSEEAIAIWFGILTLIVVEIGLITPPIGLNVYVINSMDEGITLGDSFRGTIPFVVSGLLLLGTILFVPTICLWLPGLG